MQQHIPRPAESRPSKGRTDAGVGGGMKVANIRGEPQLPAAEIVYSGTSLHGKTTRPRMGSQQIGTGRGLAANHGGTLLERASEVSTLIGASAAASMGRGSVVVVGGSPGVGKSRLLAVGRAVAEERGMHVLSAAGRDHERDYSFGVAVQLFESLITAATATERERLLAGAGPLAAELLVSGPGRPISTQDEFALEHGLYRLSASLAEQEPLLVSIDDAQLA